MFHVRIIIGLTEMYEDPSIYKFRRSFSLSTQKHQFKLHKKQFCRFIL